jgi:hypothetical protein
MAVVQGIKEKVHLPIYDCLAVKPAEQLRDSEPSSTFKFFVDVQKKTKLETNLQAAGLLPHYNTFEARALRVVFSDLPPEFPDDADHSTQDDAVPVSGKDTAAANALKPLQISSADANGIVSFTAAAPVAFPISANLELDLQLLVDLLHEAQDDTNGVAELDLDDDAVTLVAGPNNAYQLNDKQTADAVKDGDPIEFTVAEIKDYIGTIDDDKQPPDEQIAPIDQPAALVGKLLYNTVTSLFVGEKLMISMPTWFFPSGAGLFSNSSRFINNGEPNPTATFRFAEPIYIDKQQNFRVEIEVPDTEVLKELQRIYGPMFMWVVLDGYMTRDVQ